MQHQKKKAKSTHTDYKYGPSYAEVLQRVQSSYDQIKLLMADEESTIRNKVSSEIEISVEIVNEFLCFSENVSKQVLKKLAELKADKHFFVLGVKIGHLATSNTRLITIKEYSWVAIIFGSLKRLQQIYTNILGA